MTSAISACDVWLGCPWQQRRRVIPGIVRDDWKWNRVVNGSRPPGDLATPAGAGKPRCRPAAVRADPRSDTERAAVGEINAAARQAREYFRNTGVVVRRLHSESCSRGRPTFGRTTCRKCSVRSPTPDWQRPYPAGFAFPQLGITYMTSYALECWSATTRPTE